MKISQSFPLSRAEEQDLEKQFGRLVKYASWRLIKSNARNNHTDEWEDVHQELYAAMLTAAYYHKRQTYIERCFRSARCCAAGTAALVLNHLEGLWRNRTRHGAGRQKFGPYQEELLDRLVGACVPEPHRPSKAAPLVLDGKFARYAKAIMWNAQKGLGRRITREKAIRTGQVSLSVYDLFGGR